MADLLDRLSADLRPVGRRAVAGRLVSGVGAGAAVSALLTAGWLGLRPDMGQATGQAMFWAKFAYTLGLAAAALLVAERWSRPAGLARARLWLLGAPVLAIALAAMWRLAQAPPAERGALMMGGSASVCPWLILLMSLPPLAGLVWAVQGLAPTRLRLTGAVLGVAAGGAGAAAYALHCTESAAPFVAVWYSLGMLGAGALGALAGPRLLRW